MNRITRGSHSRSVARAVSVALRMSVLAVALVTHSAAAQDGHTFYERAQALYAEGKLPEAVIEIKNALQADPGILPAYTLLAEVYLSVGAAAAAGEALAKARELGADRALVWPLQAQALLQERKYDKVLKTVPTEGYPPDVLAKLLVARGHAQASLRQLAEAEDTYAKAIALAPSAPAPQVGMARVALLKGDVTAAQSRALRAVQVIPDSAEVWAIHGDVAHVLGDEAKALTSYDRAIALEPRHAEARLARAAILVGQQRLDDAQVEFDELAALVPNDPRLTYLKALRKGRLGDKMGASEELARAKSQLDEMGEEAVKESAQLLMLGGIANFQGGQLQRAQDYLERYIDMQPQRAEPRKLLARILLRQGVAKQAIQTLEEVLLKSRPDADLFSLLAEAYTAEGRHDIAGRYLEKALELKPDAESVRSRYALTQIRTGREKEGLKALAAIFDEEPGKRQGVGTILAAHYLKRGDSTSALTVTQTLLDSDPENLTFLNLHGSALASNGDLDQARLTFERAVNLGPSFVPGSINLGKVLARQNRLDEARAVLERLLEARPDNIRTMVELARMATAAGDADDALRWLERARGADPRSQPAALALIDLQLRQGRAKDALAVAEEAQAWWPDDEELLSAMAQAQIALGRRDLAVALYRRISRTAGFDTQSQYRVARRQAQVGAHDDAIYSLEKGLKELPDHLPSRVLLVELLGRANRLERGIEAAQGLSKKHPDNPIVLRLEAEMLGRVGRLDEAKEAIVKAQKAGPSLLNVLTLARLHNVSGDGKSARKTLLGWLEKNPEDAPAEVALADSYMSIGEYDRARKHYEKVIARRGESPLVLNNLANALDRLGKPKAVEMARKAHELSPENPFIADTLGWLLVRGGDAEQGLRYLRDAHTRAVANPEIRYHIAEALAALGREREALEEVKEALKTPSGLLELEQAKALLQRLSAN